MSITVARSQRPRRARRSDRRPGRHLAGRRQRRRPRGAGPAPVHRRARRAAGRGAAGAALAYRIGAEARHRGDHRRARRGQVDPGRPAHRRGRVPEGTRARRCWPSTPPRPSPAARSWATGSACRTTPSTPASSSARWPRVAISAGLALAVPEAVRVLATVGLPLVLVETVGVGQVEVEVAGRRRHDGRGGQPPLGRRRPGQQGRAARDRRRLRDQQGRPARARPRRAATSSRCSTCRPRRLAPAGRRDGGGHRRGRGRPVGGDRTPPGAAAADGSLARRRRDRLERELRQVLAARIEDEIQHLTGGEEFAAAVASRSSSTVSTPTTAADRLIREVGRAPSTAARPWRAEPAPNGRRGRHRSGAVRHRGSGTVRPWPTRGPRWRGPRGRGRQGRAPR